MAKLSPILTFLTNDEARTYVHVTYNGSVSMRDLCIYDSIDGTQIRMYWHKHQWCVATKNCLDGSNRWNGPTFYDMTMHALRRMRIDTRLWNKDHTYFFVLCHPANRIVTEYMRPMLFHLATISNKTGNYVNDPVKGAYFPKYFGQGDTLEEHPRRAWDREGVVLVHPTDMTFPRLRILNPNYYKVFLLRGNQPSPLFRYIELYKENMHDSDQANRVLDAYLLKYPEHSWVFDMFRDYVYQECTEQEVQELSARQLFNKIRDAHRDPARRIPRYKNLYRNKLPSVYQQMM